MSRRRQLVGIAISLGVTLALSLVMLPMRHQLDFAVIALVLVIPVVIGAVVGGLVAGLSAVVLGFFAYDLLFIPPYGTLSVSRQQGWEALAVYVVVMVLVSRVVGRLCKTEAASRQSHEDTARLFELSELLVGERPAADLFSLVVSTVREAFNLSSVVLLLPRPQDDKGGSALHLVARDGRELAPRELEVMIPVGGAPWPLSARGSGTGGTRGEGAQWTEAVVLTVQNRPVGILGVLGPRLPPHRQELLKAFANHVALAIERSNVKDQDLKVQLLEQVDRHRRYLFGAVSHDLRTPLAAIKAAASALLGPSVGLNASDRAELAELIESQADRLTRVVSNLLDMTRIQSGTLVLNRTTISVDDLFDEARDALGARSSAVQPKLPVPSPLLVGDRVLLVEALVNLLENALRFSPANHRVELTAGAMAGDATVVEISVRDYGPGFPRAGREASRDASSDPSIEENSSGGGSGLGLSIATAFVEAHGGTLRIEDATPGTRVLLQLPQNTVRRGEEEVERVGLV